MDQCLTFEPYLDCAENQAPKENPEWLSPEAFDTSVKHLCSGRTAAASALNVKSNPEKYPRMILVVIEEKVVFAVEPLLSC